MLIRSNVLIGVLALAVVLLPMQAAAFDCTPIISFGCNFTHYALLNADSVPGIPVCGFDYTGWNFHVYQMVVAAPGMISLQIFGQDVTPNSHLLVFKDCPLTNCIVADQYSGDGLNITECFDTGFYTVILASNAPSSPVYIVSTSPCFFCDTVSGDNTTWGNIKGFYR